MRPDRGLHLAGAARGHGQAHEPGRRARAQTLGARSYLVAAALVLLYGLLIWLDSSSLTAGAAGSADPERRGATLALHSMAGYAGGAVGPIVIGWILDLSGGMSPMGWGWAFLHVAVIALLGQVAFVLLGPRDLAGDRRSAPGRSVDRA